MNKEALEQIAATLLATADDQLTALKEELEIANTIVVLQKRAMINLLNTRDITGRGILVADTTDLEIPEAPARVEFFLNTDEQGEQFIDMRDADGE
jgi:hypothetical protein